MTLLNQIKDEYAKEQGFDSYDELVHLLTYGMANKHTVQFHYDQIAKRYAKAILERASENIAGESRQDEIQRIIENTKLD